MIDCYPTEEELKEISDMDVLNDKDWERFIDKVRDLHKYPEYIKIGKRYIYISTGGWSGNEDLINAMSKNWIAWSMYWISTERGGHYKFLKKRKFA